MNPRQTILFPRQGKVEAEASAKGEEESLESEL